MCLKFTFFAEIKAQYDVEGELRFNAWRVFFGVDTDYHVENLHGFTSSLYKAYIPHTKPLTAFFCLSSATNTISDIVINLSRACLG